jgi:hypothetical protein
MGATQADLKVGLYEGPLVGVQAVFVEADLQVGLSRPHVHKRKGRRS